MGKRTHMYYWWCQLGGWGMFILVYTFFYATLSSKQQPYFFHSLFSEAITGFTLTHFLRTIIRESKLLAIVKNYLALEQIRFEDRLQVEMDIDEDTLQQPVPPMMLQTLVENAIKHGISKLVNGGHVRIVSDFRDDHHELIIRNTGHLNGAANNAGFGLNSTRNRLHLLYGAKAAFSIQDVDGKEVEAKVILPVQAI